MKKALVVILLLAAGFGGAMLFRLPADADRTAWRTTDRAAPRPAVTLGQKEMQKETLKKAPPIQGVPAAPLVRPQEEGPQNQPERPAVLQPGARPPLPRLTQFEDAATGESESAAAPSKVAQPGAVREDRTLPPPVARLHTIVNGDTLERISRRYLGDAAWADAIYRANRNIISDRDRLPLGTTIKIPPAEHLAGTLRAQHGAEKRLVPLPNWNAKSGR